MEDEDGFVISFLVAVATRPAVVHAMISKDIEELPVLEKKREANLTVDAMHVPNDLVESDRDGEIQNTARFDDALHFLQHFEVAIGAERVSVAPKAIVFE